VSLIAGATFAVVALGTTRLIGGFHDPWSVFGEATGEHAGSHECKEHTFRHDG